MEATKNRFSFFVGLSSAPGKAHGEKNTHRGYQNHLFAMRIVTHPVQQFRDRRIELRLTGIRRES
jgi:hypothetical protein